MEIGRQKAKKILWTEKGPQPDLFLLPVARKTAGRAISALPAKMGPRLPEKLW